MLHRIIAILLAVCCAAACLKTARTTAAGRPAFHASFLQGWLCRDWTAERWTEEFSAMQAAGFEAVILQTVCDLTYERTDTAAHAQNPAAYTLTTAYSLYPSEIPVLEGAYLSSQNGGDALELAFLAAEETGMQIWLGLAGDDRWWQYGWGMPAAAADGTSYFAAWCTENGQLSAALAEELSDRYGERFADQLAGWYYVNEIWNMDAACAGTDDGVYASLIGQNIRTVLDAIEVHTPDKPLLISPFFNDTLSTPEQYGDFWAAICQQANFRQCDVFAHQDGGGGGRSADVIREWAIPLRDAVRPHMQFWVNHECFQPDYAAKPVSELEAAMEATKDLTQTRILFSWNHYYHPLVTGDAAYQTAFLELVSRWQKAAGDVNADGICGVADVVMLQQFLLGVGDLTDAAAADTTDDGSVNGFDLAILKRMVLGLV